MTETGVSETTIQDHTHRCPIHGEWRHDDEDCQEAFDSGCPFDTEEDEVGC